MHREFREWVDFGADGRAPESVSIDYRPDAMASVVEDQSERIDRLWESAKRERPGLFDAPGFRLLEASDTGIVVGPAQFKQHFVRRLLLSDSLETSATRLRDELEESIRYLSSMVAIAPDDDLLIGVKRRTDSNFLSLPGSGYLDRNGDMRAGELCPTAEIVAREVYEETGLEDLDRIRCFGIFEDLHPESHLNPALFSIITTSRSSDHVLDRIDRAEDADEFDRFLAVPLRPDALSALIRTDTNDAELPVAAPKLEGDLNGISDKTLLMLLLIGRNRFGRDWFQRELANSSVVLVRK